MNNEEKNNQIEEIIFSYEVKKDNKVFIYWYEKLIKIISGEKAEKFLLNIKSSDIYKAQQLMAKITGNIKRKRDENTNTIIIRGTHYTRSKN